MVKSSRYLLAIVFIILPMVGFADTLGEISISALASVRGLSSVMSAICYVAGVGFLIGGLLQYKYHRENPQQVRISAPIVLVLLGICFIAIPFLSTYSDASKFVR